jgi:hypothetical protein
MMSAGRPSLTMYTGARREWILALIARLTQVEELVLIQSVIDIDKRDFPLGIVDIRDAAQLLFDDRDGGKVG